MRKTELLEDQALSTRLKVEAITLREIRMPLDHFFETSFGRTYSRRILLVTVHCEAGDGRIKLKVKPGWDLKILERVRSRWPNILLSCDANSAYTLDDIDHLRKFDQFNLLMIEQPLWNDDIYYHARLQRELRTSICLD